MNELPSVTRLAALIRLRDRLKDSDRFMRVTYPSTPTPQSTAEELHALADCISREEVRAALGAQP